MGIAGLQKWFKQRYGHCAQTYNECDTGVDHLYIDLQSVLHICIRKSKQKKRFHSRLHTDLNQILTIFKPKKSILLALDGPGPLAKLKKERRDRLARYKKIQKRKKNVNVSQLCLTTGAEFMLDIHDSLTYFICNKLGQNFQNVVFEFSSSTVQGEGETKLFQRILSPLPYIKQGDNQFVLGGDSDLILMCLMQFNVKNLFLLVDNSENTSPNSKLSYMEQLQSDYLVWSMEKIQESWELKDKKSFVDFGFLIIMGEGNDYLPGLRGVSAFSASPKNLWDTYLRMRTPQNTEYHSQGIFLRRSKKTGMLQINTKFLIDLLVKCHITEFPEARNQKKNFNAKNCELYLKMLFWNVDMYLKGVCSNYRALYNAPGVHVEHLIKYLQSVDNKQHILEIELDQFQPPLKPAGCALAMLPPKTEGILQESLRHLMDPDSPIGELYEECKICDQYDSELSSLQQQLYQRKQYLKENSATLLKQYSDQISNGKNNVGKNFSNGQKGQQKVVDRNSQNDESIQNSGGIDDGIDELFRNIQISDDIDDKKAALLEQSQNLGLNLDEEQLNQLANLDFSDNEYGEEDSAEDENSGEETEEEEDSNSDVEENETQMQSKTLVKKTHGKKELRGRGLIEANDKKYQQLKDKLKATVVKRLLHTTKMHPPKELPIDKIQQLVQEIQVQQKEKLSRRELALFEYGDTQIFIHSRKEQQIKKFFIQKSQKSANFNVVYAPKAPVPSWGPLKGSKVLRQYVPERVGGQHTRQTHRPKKFINNMHVSCF